MVESLMLQRMKMTMSKTLPWHDIKTPKDDLSVRRIRECEILSLYWGKDPQGHCLFIFELEANGLAIFQENRVSVYGINIDLNVLKPTGNQALILTLDKHINQDLFYQLCETLIQALQNVIEPLTGLSITLAQIKRWKLFLAGGRERILSLEEIRGLYSELIFLQQTIAETESEYQACDCWQGPEMSHQDFIFSDTAVEVKSLSGRERNTIKISSEDQLETVNENLFINVFRLLEKSGTEYSVSLNELVKNIENTLTDSEALELFHHKLAKYGYVELRAYDSPEFIVADEHTYKVEKNFPKLIRSELPVGMLKVSYEIKLEAIKSYMCHKQDIWNK